MLFVLIYIRWRLICIWFIQGLVQLFEFKEKNPDADIEPYLKKSSQFFQNYIERGLKRVEMERQCDSKMATSASSEGSNNSGNCHLFIKTRHLKVLN